MVDPSLAVIVVRRTDNDHDNTPNDEFNPSSNIYSGMDVPPRSAYLPLARRCHRAHALRHGLKWMIPLAAWLYPIFLLRFVRTQPLWRGILLGTWAACWCLCCLGHKGRVSRGLVLPHCLGLWHHLHPGLPDRPPASPTTGRDTGYPRVPARCDDRDVPEWVVRPFHATQTNPAYTQYGNLPLLQLLSVTGLWGITFVMSWLASLVNWAWERGFAWPRVRSGAVLYAGLLALVLLFGGARLALFPAQASTVRLPGSALQPPCLPLVSSTSTNSLRKRCRHCS